MNEVKRLALQRRFDYLIVESTGVSVPLPVAATFSHVDGDTGFALSNVARLDTLVTVVDSERFIGNVMEAAALREKGLQASREPFV